MIETQLRATFARAEHLVPAVADLEPAIGAEVRRRRGRRRLLRSGAAALAVLVAVAVPAVGRAWWDRPASAPTPAGQPGAGLNILIAGLDGPRADGPRFSDSLFIAHIPADHSAGYLVAVPRDLEVEVPGFGRDRINTAYARGGLPLLERTLGGLTGAAFDATVTVELDGLRRLVDTLGGVYLCVDERGRSVHTGRVFELGCRQFTGAEAMDYLRQRVGYASGAHARDRHVAQFLAALLTQLQSKATFANPARIAEIIGIVRTNATIDARRLDLGAVVALGGALSTLVMVDVPVVEPSEGLVRLGPGAAGLFAALRSDTLAAWAAANPPSVRPL